MTRLFSDFKFALRTLSRSPLFTVVAVLSLALGIGANTAIFTLLDQLILRLLPVKSPEQLVMIWTTGPHIGNNRGSRAASYPMYQDFQRKAPAFSYVFCRYSTPLSISFQGQTERVNAELVSGNFFDAMGVGPALGRVFSPQEDDRQYKGHPVIVLSHDYWATRFNGNPNVVGQKILVNNYPMTIVGVSAAGFAGMDPSQSPQIRIPIQMKPLMTPGWDDIGNRRAQWIQMFARMKPGYTVTSAQASLQPLLSQILQDESKQPEMNKTSRYDLQRFLKRQVRVVQAANGYSQTRESYSTALIVLMCMVGLVLVIACSNVASLLVARAVARQKEIAVRLAVGASRGQLIGQLLIESVLLSISGGVTGLLLSVAIIKGLLSFLPSDGSPLLLKATPDWRILTFNFVLACLSGLVFGLAPALQSTRLEMWDTLKNAGGAVAGASSSIRLRKGLVTAQVALSFLLLAGAGLFVKTLGNLKGMNSGFHEIDRLVTFQVDPSLSGYALPQIKFFYKQLLENVRAVPGVKSASYASVPVMHGWEWDSSLSVEGHQAKDGEDIQAFMNSLAPDYWKTMGIRMVDGRDFTLRDEGAKIKSAIVNRKFAQHYFGSQSPIGRHIGFGGGPDTKLDIEIVGVAEDALYEGPREGVHRQVFVSDFESQFPSSVSFYVRTSLDANHMFAALRNEVKKLDGALPIYEMKTLETQVDETLSTERLIAVLSAAFGLLATLLAALGLYGVMAYVVARRTKEIGLRMALGSPRGQVVWLVMREVLTLLGIGIAIGAPCAYLLSRYVASQLFGITATDLGTAAMAVSILAAVATAAGFLPARRATSIDPIQALRYE